MLIGSSGKIATCGKVKSGHVVVGEDLTVAVGKKGRTSTPNASGYKSLR